MEKMEKFTKVAAHGLIKKDGKYLVTKRSDIDDYMPGFWDLPGGTIKFGESIESALKREIKEETDLETKQGKILFAYGYLSGEFRHQFQLVFECDFVSGEVKLDDRFHSEYRWVNWNELGGLNKIAFLEEFYKTLKENK